MELYYRPETCSADIKLISQTLGGDKGRRKAKLVLNLDEAIRNSFYQRGGDKVFV